jgi:carbon-monoxide dehydrogenase large subunit
MDLAAKLRSGINLPEGVPTSLDVQHVSDGPSASTFPNGCHVCEVEVDPETGVIEVVKYASVNDFGTVINPIIVEGQLHGGVVQGIGQTLMEMTAYDSDGQLLTGSYMIRHAARERRAELLDRRPRRAGHHRSASKAAAGHARLAHLDHECGGRCAGSEYGIRHIDMPPPRTASGRRSAPANANAD